ncbi:MAG: FmdB family zinc ribbon protein [Chloroflexota bacterium]
MPIYDYVCESCGHVVEVMHSIAAPGPTTCERCGGAMKRALSVPAIVFKGSGWAKKDARDARASKTPASTGGDAPSAGTRRLAVTRRRPRSLRRPRQRQPHQGTVARPRPPPDRPRPAARWLRRRARRAGAARPVDAALARDAMSRPRLSLQSGSAPSSDASAAAAGAGAAVRDGRLQQRGGGLLASGLAFSALFATPGLPLLVSVLVIAVDDAQTRADAIAWVIERVPPLETVATGIVNNLANGARVGSIVGLVASCGVPAASISPSMGPSTGSPGAPRARPGDGPGPRRGRGGDRGVRGARGLATSVGVSVAVTFLGLHLDGLLPIVSPLVAIVVAWVVCLACYLLVPVQPPAWRVAVRPAIIAGTFVGLLTSFFGALAPVLVSGFQGLGLIASVFVALVWLNWLFQAVLLGAAYARALDVQARTRIRTLRIF